MLDGTAGMWRKQELDTTLMCEPGQDRMELHPKDLDTVKQRY